MTDEDTNDLKRLRTAYGKWSIWRSQTKGRLRGWVATNMSAKGCVPTLHGDTAKDLERQLKNPPRAVGIGVPEHPRNYCGDRRW